MNHNNWFHGGKVALMTLNPAIRVSDLGETGKLFNAKKYMKFCWYYGT